MADASVQSEDSTNDRTIFELRDSFAKATEALTQHRQDLSIARAEATAKDLHITSLTEARREFQALCSAMQKKAAKDEATVVELTGRLANLEAEGASKDARIASFMKKNEEWRTDATSMQNMIAFQEAALLQLTDILKTQDRHIDALSETVKSQKQMLTENDATIAQLNAKVTEQTSDIDSMRHHISSLSEECENLASLRKSLTEDAARDEVTIAQLKLSLAEKTAAAGDWKDLYIQSLSQPHQPRMCIPRTDATFSTLSMQGIIAEKDRRIAELSDKLSECYGQLVASQAGNLAGPFSLSLPSIVVGESAGDHEDVHSRSRSFNSALSSPPDFFRRGYY
ncbi:hypothetical protein H1R20_g6269, partial [Candolleomyces eurysporus]